MIHSIRMREKRFGKKFSYQDVYEGNAFLDEIDEHKQFLKQQFGRMVFTSKLRRGPARNAIKAKKNSIKPDGDIQSQKQTSSLSP